MRTIAVSSKLVLWQYSKIDFLFVKNHFDRTLLDYAASFTLYYSMYPDNLFPTLSQLYWFAGFVLLVIGICWIRMRSTSTISTLANSTLTNSIDPRKWNVANEYQHMSPDEFSAVYRRIADNTAVACINISGDWNIGMMMRTSAAYGIGRFIVLGRRVYDRRTTVGVEKHLPTDRISTMDDSELDETRLIGELTRLQREYTVIFIEQRVDSISVDNIRSISLNNKPALFVFGSESHGIPAAVLLMPDTYCVTIPQRGIVRSLNVAIAHGIVLSAWYSRNIPAVSN